MTTDKKGKKPSDSTASPRLRKLIRSIDALHKRFGRRSADGRREIGFSTAAQRRKELRTMARILHKRGFELTDIANLKQKHIRALFIHWEGKGTSAATLQKYASLLALLERWIEKHGMMGDPRQYLENAACFERDYVAKNDKTPSGNGIDLEALFAAVTAISPRVAMHLHLQASFGLRVKESMLLQPYLSDRGSTLEVYRGTKGRRYRPLPIDTEYQREVLDHAKTFASSRSSTLVPADYSLYQWTNYFRRVVRGVGLTRKAKGVTPHGFRHDYLSGQYLDLTGCLCPVKGGVTGELTAEEDRAARMVVAERAGHSRTQIASAYLGPVLQFLKDKTTKH